jgi:hypothetical protein
MKDLFSKCGYNCGRCPSYRVNLKTADDRKRCSDGWFKYFGFRLTAPKLRSCDGCQTPNSENPLLYISCRVRKCAQRNGAKTCAHCSAFPCEDVNQVGNAENLRERIENRLESVVPEKDYAVFIEPYEGIKNLERIRSSLCPQDIVEMETLSRRRRIFDFPEDLPFSGKKTKAFQALHRLLSGLDTIEGVSYARKEALNTSRTHLLRILWGFGLCGRFDRQRRHLEMDSVTYRSLKLLSYPFEKVKRVFLAFKEFGVLCLFVPPEEDGWLTPTGALKEADWRVEMSFRKGIGGEDTLKALKEYSLLLDKKYGEEAFKHFARAEMKMLKKEDS